MTRKINTTREKTVNQKIAPFKVKLCINEKTCGEYMEDWDSNCCPHCTAECVDSTAYKCIYCGQSASRQEAVADHIDKEHPNF